MEREKHIGAENNEPISLVHSLHTSSAKSWTTEEGGGRIGRP